MARCCQWRLGWASRDLRQPNEREGIWDDGLRKGWLMTMTCRKIRIILLYLALLDDSRVSAMASEQRNRGVGGIRLRRCIFIKIYSFLTFLLFLTFSFELFSLGAFSFFCFFFGACSSSLSTSLSAPGSTFGGAFNTGGLGDLDESESKASLSSPASDSDSARGRFLDEAFAAFAAAFAAFLILGAVAEVVAAAAAGEKGSARREPVSEIMELAMVMLQSAEEG